MKGAISADTRVPLADEVAEIVRRAILDGEVRPGQKVIQAELAGQLGISRGPVREALRLLIGEGLIEEKPRLGTYAAYPTVRDVRELYDIRVALEVRAAQRVLKSDRSAAVDGMQHALTRLGASVGGRDSRAAAWGDFEFHQALVRASGNTRLAALYAQQSIPIRQLLVIDDASYEDLSSLIGEHRMILEALAGGRGQDLLDLLVSHLNEASDRLAAAVQSREPPHSVLMDRSGRQNDKTSAADAFLICLAWHPSRNC